jgi:hypothetical protein
MKYLNPSFSSRPANKKFRDNWDQTFGKKKESPEPTFRDALIRIAEHRFPIGWHWDEVWDYARRCATGDWELEKELRKDLKEE